ncbi:MAG TPA: hypothetical protein VMD76_13445, partial [Candidatus Sulfotelmatobacter sp.]|nr:hypothetical protein [Candidatus Sulfotelmatobacter sp.]
REHFSRASSFFNHRLKFGSKVSPDDFLQKNAENLCYGPLLAELKKADFKVTALDYHGPDWVERFLGYLGFARREIPAFEHRLVAFSPKTTIAKMAINRIARSERQNRRLTHAFRDLPGSYRSSGFIFSRDAAAKAEPLFAVDRRLIAKELGIDLVPPDLNQVNNSLFITTEEFREIQALAEGFGTRAREIADFASQFVRT